MHPSRRRSRTLPLTALALGLLLAAPFATAPTALLSGSATPDVRNVEVATASALASYHPVVGEAIRTPLAVLDANAATGTHAAPLDPEIHWDLPGASAVPSAVVAPSPPAVESPQEGTTLALDFPAALDLPGPALDVAPPAPGLVGALTYRACGQLVAKAVVCSPIAVPFGAPVGLDLDGDPATGVAGLDVVVEVAPVLGPAAAVGAPPAAPEPPGLPGGPPTVPAPTVPAAADVVQAARAGAEAAARPGLFVATRVDVLPSLGEAQRALPAKVWVAYGVPDEDWNVARALRVGLDGSADRLPAGLLATLRIADFEDLLQGRLVGQLNLSFTDPGARVAVFAEADRLDAAGLPQDPVSVSALLVPPVDLVADLDIALDGTRAVVAPRLAAPTTVLVDVQAREGERATRVLASAVPLPAQSRITYEQRSGGIIAAAFEGDAALPSVLLRYERSEPDLVLSGDVSATGVPDRFALTLDPRAAAGSLAYEASGSVLRVVGTVTRTQGSSATTSDTFDITNLPTAARVDWTLSAEAVAIVVNATARFGPVYVLHRAGADQPAFDVGLREAPKWLRAQVAGDVYTAEARADWFRASGTSDVAGLLLRFASDGALPAPLAGDHVLYQETSSATRASARVDGLRFASLDLSKAGDLRVELRLASPREVRFEASLPSIHATGVVSKVPDFARIEKSGNTLRYTTSAPLDRVETTLRAPQVELLQVTAKGVPASMQVVYDLGAKRINYTASGRVAELVAAARGLVAPHGPWTVDLALANLAPAWEAQFRDGVLTFDAASPTDRVTLAAANAGQALLATCASGLPNEACARLDVPNEAYRVRVDMAKLQRLHVGKDSRGPFVDLAGGDGGAALLDVIARVSAADQLFLVATTSKLPGTFKGSFGALVQATASETFDLAMNAFYGHANALGRVALHAPSPFGVVLRDGANPVQPAEKAAGIYVRVPGMPTTLELGKTAITAACPTGPCIKDAYIVNAQGLRTTVDNLTADVDLKVTLEKPLFAKLWVNGLAVQGAAPAKNLRVVFGPYELGSDKVVDLGVATSPALGALSAHVAYGEQQGRVDLALVPTTLTAQLRAAEAQTRVKYAAGGDVPRAYIAYAKAPAPATTFGLAAELRQVPQSVDLAVGRNAAGPDLQYTASADTLDLDLSVSPAVFGGDAKTRVEAHALDLGRSVKATFANGKLSLASTPATAVLDLSVWTSYHLDPGRVPGGWTWDEGSFATVSASASWHHDYKLAATVEQLQLRWSKLSSWSLTLGLPFVIDGTYDEFRLTWGGLRYDLDIDAAVTFTAKASIPSVGLTSPTVTLLSKTLNKDLPDQVSVYFHVGNNHAATFAPLTRTEPFNFPCYTVTGAITTTTNPHNHGGGMNSVTTYGAGSTLGGDGGNGKWWILPDFPSGGGGELGPALGPLVLWSMASPHSMDSRLSVTHTTCI